MSWNFNSGWPPGSEPYQQLIEQAAKYYSVPVGILAWLLWKESSYRPDVINGTTRSSAGAMGIAQFMPSTAREILGSEEAALDPGKAIAGAAHYLARLFEQTSSWPSALAAYNWGIGNVRRGMMMPRETVDYVSTIMSKSGYTGYA